MSFDVFFPSTALELEIGGGRRISEFSTIRMLYIVGIQVMSFMSKYVFLF